MDAPDLAQDHMHKSVSHVKGCLGCVRKINKMAKPLDRAHTGYFGLLATEAYMFGFIGPFCLFGFLGLVSLFFLRYMGFV